MYTFFFLNPQIHFDSIISMHYLVCIEKFLNGQVITKLCTNHGNIEEIVKKFNATFTLVITPTKNVILYNKNNKERLIIRQKF